MKILDTCIFSCFAYLLVLQYHLMVIAINMIFMCLAVFNLAYLGQMFLSDPEMEEFDHQVLSKVVHNTHSI